MTLRPRYSLLTLLVLTALVAGGVKWWRGPGLFRHSTPNLEYSYSLDEHNNQVVHGTFIVRMLKIDGVHSRVNLYYFRHGEALWQRRCQIWPMYTTLPADFELSCQTLTDSPLSAAEQQDFQALYEREKQKLLPLRFGYELLETQGPRRSL